MLVEQVLTRQEQQSVIMLGLWHTHISVSLRLIISGQQLSPSQSSKHCLIIITLFHKWLNFSACSGWHNDMLIMVFTTWDRIPRTQHNARTSLEALFINSFNIPRLQDSQHTLLYLMLRSRLVRRLGWRHGLRCWGSCWWWRSVSWRRIRSGGSSVVVVVSLSRGQGARRRLFSWRSVAWWVEREGRVVLVVRVGVGVRHWAGAREVWSGRSLEWGGSMVTSSFTVRGSVSVSPLWTQSPGLLRWSGVGEGQLTRLGESAGAGVASTAGARWWDWSRGQDLVTWSPSLTPTASLHHHRVSGDHQLTQSHHPQSPLSTLHSGIVKEADALVSVTNMDYTRAGGYISPH